MPLPPHVIRRQGDVLRDLLRGAIEAVAAGRPLDVHLAGVFRAHREYGARDRRLFGDALFALFRWRGALDALGLTDPGARLAVAWALDDRPPHPVLDQLGADGDAALPLHLDAARALPVDVLAPDWLRAALWYPPAVAPQRHFQQVVRSLQQRPPTWLRCRPGQLARIRQACSDAGGQPFPYPRLPDALGLGQSIPLAALHQATAGGFEVQDVASQAVGLLCAAQSGEQWWDVCAGAGGKTLHLADRVGRGGRVLATDVRPAALEELARRARAAGCRNIHTDLAPAAPPPGSCHGVLVDAPCSGVGTWSRNPDLRWRTVDTEPAAKAVVQGELLERAAAAVRPGGRLVYAVCTITEAETTAVSRAFSARHDDFRRLELDHPLADAPPAVERMLWPWDGPGDGMYVAAWRRGT